MRVLFIILNFKSLLHIFWIFDDWIVDSPAGEYIWNFLLVRIAGECLYLHLDSVYLEMYYVFCYMHENLYILDSRIFLHTQIYSSTLVRTHTPSPQNLSSSRDRACTRHAHIHRNQNIFTHFPYTVRPTRSIFDDTTPWYIREVHANIHDTVPSFKFCGEQTLTEIYPKCVMMMLLL